jgi:PilZ domain
LFRAESNLSRNSPRREQRKWARLQLAIPVFVRSKDGNGKEALEFATALNISAGGALVLVRHSLTKSSPVSLEIPSAPIGAGHGIRRSSRTIRARTIWVTHLNDYHLLGLKFARPLSTDTTAVPRTMLRKAGSAV